MDLNSVIDAAVELVRPAALRKGVALVRVGSGDGRMQGDAQRLQQIVSNLVANAVKFTPTGGTATIALLTSPATLEIVVDDTGEGIHADLIPHIFEPFRQGDGSATRRHPGIGLGLTIVQHLVHGHGGTVHVDARALAAVLPSAS